jgi:2-polyprenyl-3-methyl-5-hydroxy-6-metoxy-1,4-benzoquinol methylase
MFYDKAQEDLKTAKNKNVTLINELLQDCEDIFENERFDFILVSSLLHEIPNQIEFFKTLKNISTADTVTHINVPNAKSFHRLLAVEMGLIDSVYEMSSSNIQFQQHEVFDLARLRELVENNGFDVIDSGSYSFKPFTHSQMQNMINNDSISEQMLDGFFNMENYLEDIGSEIYVNVKRK